MFLMLNCSDNRIIEALRLSANFFLLSCKLKHDIYCMFWQNLNTSLNSDENTSNIWKEVELMVGKNNRRVKHAWEDFLDEYKWISLQGENYF